MRLATILPARSSIKWLLSETLVVVLGVLIALWINDYWTFRQERVLERQYVERLLEDVETDIDYIDGQVTQMLDAKFEALRTIRPVVFGEQPVPDDIESFMKNVSLAAIGGASSTYWVVDTTFRDLINTGNLRLIGDSKLRRQIASYYDEFDEFYVRSRDRRTDYARFVWSTMPGELRDGITLNDIKEFGLDRALDQIVSEDFRRLWSEEYNFALFNRRVSSESAKALKADLERFLEGH